MKPYNLLGLGNTEKIHIINTYYVHMIFLSDVLDNGLHLVYD